MIRANVAGKVADPQAAAIGILGLRTGAQALVRAFKEGFLQLFVFFELSLVCVLLIRRPAGARASSGGGH